MKSLQRQVNELARQPGPQGPRGAEGQQGPQGPSTGPAGGDLTGNYPNAAVSSAEIANGGVLSVDLGGSAVQAANLGSAFAVVGTGVVVGPGTDRKATVTCPGGSRLLSGGFEWLSDDADGSSVISSSPTFVGDPSKTWVVRGRSDTGGPGNTIFAEALCLDT